ncbi:MAG: T9SS type A sorting domain-containing protein [Candidatus Kapabacteria bacterium]|nr:T9SS type A sorting domain-containing protein [Candidatus Kapabacteria bacterium]
MIYLHIRDVGRFDFLPKPTGNNNEVAVVNIDDLDTMFALKRVVPMDPILQQSQGTARAGVQLVIKPTGTRITNIVLESDAPWLKFQTRGSKNPIPAPSRIGRIAYIDNGILGPPNGLGFPDAQNANIPNTIDPLLNLDIICDPNELTPDNPDPRNADEWAGRYVGHITLRSLNAGVSPVRLRVVFLYVRTPDETYNGTPIDQTLAKGMTINVRNSAIVPQSSNLMFGTGLRATLNADSLFGEFAYDVAPGAGFFARWFPINATDLSKDNGLGDFTGVFASRDVRDVRDDTTIIYRCRFSAGGSNNYPVVVSWNKNQLPDGAQIYIRDLENGRRFSVNMREATPVPGDPDRLSYTIRDEKIDAFDIEYTPARARIQQNMLKGWNLVSLPVRPTSDDYRVIYPDAQGSTPIKFFADLYQQEERVRVGVGYFLRFPNDVTTVISGILVKRIARDVYPVQVYENWNTIGSLSVPVGVERIGFDPVNNTSPTPQRISGVYTYNTDRGYREISELQPGKGYWIKMNGQGFYKVDAPTQRSTPQLNDRDEVVSASARISVSDNNSRENTIYLTEGRINTAKGRFELPPTPPSDWFDVRFASNEYIATDANPVVKFQGVEYPVTVKMFNNNKAYSVIDAANGNVLGTISVGNGSCQINDDAVKSVRLLTTDNNEAFSAVAAPNPAVDELNVNVTLATNATITVSLYNTMGAQVGAQSLFATKGSTIVPFNTTALASGSYVVKIVAGDNIITRTVNIVK